MNLQLLMAFAPFIALIYLLFALIQSLRHKQQGIVAALLGLIVIALPLAAYLLAGTLLRERMIRLLTLSAAVVFVGSLLVLLIERGNRKRDPRRSYGMIGIGVSICLALITFGAPLLITTTGSTTPTASETAVAADTTLRNVSAVTRGAVRNTDAQATDPAPPANLAAATAEPDATDPTAVAQVLMAQTGLTSDELTAQVDAGSTIAELVAAHNGDLDAVITAIASALDDLVAAGGRGGQLLDRFGSDTTQIATQLVNGELAQGARFLLPQLIGGASALPQFGGGRGTFQQGGNGGNFPGAPQATVEATSEASTPTAVALALTAQTGLSSADLLAQIQAGSTIADLVGRTAATSTQ